MCRSPNWIVPHWAIPVRAKGWQRRLGSSLGVCTWQGSRRAFRQRATAINLQLDQAAIQTPSLHSYVDDWYTSEAGTLAPQIGPIQVQHIQGKGRGVVAAQAISAGQLVMLVPPLGFLRATSEQRPHPADLVTALLADPATAASPWWGTLYSGTPKSTKSLPDLQQEVLQQHTKQQQQPGSPPEAAAAPTSDPAPAYVAASSNDSSRVDSSSSSSRKKGASSDTPCFTGHSLVQGGAASQPAASSSSSSSSRRSSKARLAAKVVSRQQAPGLKQQAAQLRAQQKLLAKVVALNSYGEEHGDRAAAACRGVSPVGHLGLWPAFALLNHSCAPNTIHWVLGGAMVVRAVTDIAAGEELTISYIGRPQLQPWAPRIQHLKRLYGFNCSCTRCRAEEACYGRLGGTLEELDQQAQSELEPQLRAAAAAGDRQRLQEVRYEAQALLMVLYNSFRRHVVNPQQRRWCLASVSSCLEVVADADLLLAADTGLQVTSSKALLQAVQAVTLGSDLHVITAAQYAAAVQAAAAEGHTSAAEAAGAHQLCREAHRLRYGPVSDGLADKFAELNRSLYFKPLPDREAC